MEYPFLPTYEGVNKEESTSTLVYKQIKNKILKLEYAPGSFLTEAKLAEEYGVSRMPVRIAIQKLSSEGWLVSDFRRKLRVKEITKKSIVDIYALREILETRALQKIFEDNLTWKYSFIIEEKLLHMRAAGNHYYEFLCADSELHFALIRVFENDRIEQMYYSICDEIIRICLLLYQIVAKQEGYVATILSGMEQVVSSMREKDYSTTYFYMKRDHFDHEIDGVPVAELVSDRFLKTQGCTSPAFR